MRLLLSVWGRGTDTYVCVNLFIAFQAISCSSQCSTTGVTKAGVCVILSVG